MEGKFTFTDAKDPMSEWAYDLFDNHSDALAEGLRLFPGGVLVGQLKSNGINYKIVNVMEYTEVELSN